MFPSLRSLAHRRISGCNDFYENRPVWMSWRWRPDFENDSFADEQISTARNVPKVYKKLFRATFPISGNKAKSAFSKINNTTRLLHLLAQSGAVSWPSFTILKTPRI